MNHVHGHSSRAYVSPTYITWVGMISRCKYPKNRRYKDYGGRGIVVCERWKNFSNFLADMGERPANCSLEREDNDGNYEPGNCKWASRTEQSFNSRLRKDNTSGRRGVRWNTQLGRWLARGHLHGREYLLYCGKNFEAACTAREDWEDYLVSCEL